MNSRELYAATEQLAKTRDWPESDPRFTLLLELVYAREDARHHIRNSIASLRNDLDRLERIIQRASPLLNTLGELQQRPAAVEAAVGQFAAASKALDAYLKAFPPAGTGETT